MQKPVDVDSIASDVQQMSLESIEMPTIAAAVDTMSVTGYRFLPDPNLMPDNFIDPLAAMHGSPTGLHYQLFDASCASTTGAEQNVDQLDPSGGFPTTIDADWLSAPSPHGLDETAGTFDVADFSDLMVFPSVM